MNRPLFTLPLSSSLLTMFQQHGYRYYECLFDYNGPLAEVEKILENFGYSWNDLTEMVKDPKMQTARELYEQEEKNSSIATFSEAIDNILGGGVFLGKVLQVCGPPGSGKTQLLIQLCIDVQLPSVIGGLDGKAIFVDSERAFTYSRMKEMAEAACTHCQLVAKMYNIEDKIQNLSSENMMKETFYVEVNSHIQLLACIYKMRDLLKQNRMIKLVVIDDLVLPLLSISKTLERTKLISKIVSELQKMSESFNVAVVLVNDLTSRITAGEKMLVPALGETLSHSVPSILLLDKPSEEHFSAIMYKSSALPLAVAKFTITADGIRDFSTGS